MARPFENVISVYILRIQTEKIPSFLRDNCSREVDNLDPLCQDFWDIDR